MDDLLLKTIQGSKGTFKHKIGKSVVNLGYIVLPVLKAQDSYTTRRTTGVQQDENGLWKTKHMI